MNNETRLQRILSRATRTESGCLEYPGSRRPIAKLNGKVVNAARAVWFFTTGEMPNRKTCVCHRCDNVKCVNPDHLFLGSYSDNNTDAIRKERMRGVLPVSDVDWAKRDAQIANELGLHKTTVHGYRRRHGLRKAGTHTTAETAANI